MDENANIEVCKRAYSSLFISFYLSFHENLRFFYLVQDYDDVVSLHMSRTSALKSLMHVNFGQGYFFIVASDKWTFW